MTGLRRAVPFLCLFLSGAAGLIDEVVWIRQASLLFGSTTFATSSVVAVFFLGLALGSWLLGRLSPGITRPLRVYAILEVGLAALVVLSPLFFELAGSLYGRFYRTASSGSGDATWLVRLLLVAAVVLPPAFLMGGTLPLFCRQFVTGPTRVGRTVGFLYGLNTLGAAAGCAAAGFLLVPELGMKLSLVIAALLSAVAGITAVVAGPGIAPAPAAETRPRSGPAPQSNRTTAIVATLFFVTGFTALAAEVLWTRFLALVIRTTEHTYTISLTVVLLGIVVGTWIAAPLSDRIRWRAELFGGVMTAAALALFTTLLLPPNTWRAIGSETLTCFVLALLPALLSGAAFPIVLRMVSGTPALAGRSAGLLLAVNTLGGIAGALAIGFLSLPRLGLHGSLMLTSGTGVAAGCAAWLLLGSGPLFKRLIPVAVAVGSWLLIPFRLQTRLPADFLAERLALVDYREGLESNVAVVRKNRALQLEVDRWWQGQDRKTHQVMAAHVPMLIHPSPGRILVVGAGAGQTPQSFLAYDIERMDVVDIEPAVFDLIERHFPWGWLRDSRVRAVREDGRNYVSHTAETYDVISLEVGQIHRPGVESFYTTDFYRRVSARLNPGGVLSQFVPLPFLTPENFRSVVASFIHVFPQSLLWYNTSEFLLIGTRTDGIAIDPARLSLLASNEAIRADLAWSHWDGPAYSLNQSHVFLGGFLCGPAGLTALSAGAPLLRDDRPGLARAAGKLIDQRMNELPILEILKPRLEPVSAVLGAAIPDSTLQAAARVRDRNLGDIVAAANLERIEPLRAAGRYPEIEALLHESLRANPDNAQAGRLLADLQFLTGRSDQALQGYLQVLARKPDDAAAHLGLARLLHTHRRFAEAVVHYHSGLEQDPGDAEAWNSLGAALAEQGDLTGARRYFQEALRLNPELADARRNLTQLEGAARR